MVRPFTSSERLELVAEEGSVWGKKTPHLSQFGVESLRFIKEEKKHSDGVFDGCPLADGSKQWSAIRFAAIFALHRWVVVQISLSLRLSAFSSGGNLSRPRFDVAEAQPNNQSSGRGGCASLHPSIQGFGKSCLKGEWGVGVGRLARIVS